MNIAILIPCFEPNEMVLSFLKIFSKDDFSFFLMVNDGSSSSFEKVFDRIKKETFFEVLSYFPNKGKGFALKTGIQYIKNTHPEIDAILTCDSDGQHLLKDVLRIKQVYINHKNELILGVRNFLKEKVPIKSKIGNDLSNYIFSLSTRSKLVDTQTGLRVIPKSIFDTALSIPGNRYDYEFTFLLEIVDIVDIREVEITTVYENGKNETTHFRPILDTIRIYRIPLLRLSVKISSIIISCLAFFLMYQFIFIKTLFPVSIILSLLSSNIISSIFGFPLLIEVTYSNKMKKVEKAFKYILSTLIYLLISFGFILLFTYLFNWRSSTQLLLLKLVLDIVFLVLGYVFNWLFRPLLRKINK